MVKAIGPEGATAAVESIQRDLPRIGPVATLKKLGVTDPAMIAAFKRKMETFMDVDKDDDVEEIGRRFMGAATLDDIDKRTKIMQSMPKLEKIDEDDLLADIDAL